MLIGIDNMLIDMYNNLIGIIATIFRSLNLSAKLLLVYCGRFN